MTTERLDELIQKSVLGNLTESEAVELSDHLEREDAVEARRKLRLALRADTYLQEAALEMDLGGEGGEGSAAKSSKRVLSLERLLWPLGSIAAGLLIGLFIWNQKPVEDDQSVSIAVSDSPIDRGDAILNRITNATWPADATPLSPGSAVLSGAFELEEGLAQIDLISGVQLLVEGPVKLEIRSAREVFLHHGEVTCFVGEAGRGFRLLTADSEVVDLGTSFSARAQPGVASQFHVHDGKITVRPQGADEAREILARQAVKVAGVGTAAVEFAAEDFPKIADLLATDENEKEAAYQRWRETARSLSADPATLLHYTMDDGSGVPADHLSELRDASSGVGSNATLLGVTPEAGRFGRKTALAFRQDSDRVLAQLPGAYDELTMMVWAKFHSHSHPGVSALILVEKPSRWLKSGFLASARRDEVIAARDKQPNKILRWTVGGKHGSALSNFQIARHGDDPHDLRWTRTRAAPEGNLSKRLGEWVCLSLVYNSLNGTVTHYLDGEVTGKHRVDNLGPFPLELLEIGNLTTGAKERERGVSLAFRGLIDEVFISSRALSDTELRSIFKAGHDSR